MSRDSTQYACIGGVMCVLPYSMYYHKHSLFDDEGSTTIPNHLMTLGISVGLTEILESES